MEYLQQSIVEALRLIAALDPDVVEAVWASLRFACASTLLACALGIPAGTVLATRLFPARRLCVTVVNTLLALPTVVVGLFVYALICRQGPLGGLGLLYTPYGIIAGQTVLIFPLVTALTNSAVASVDPVYRETARTLGAGALLCGWVVLREARTGILVAGVTAFGRVAGEVGVAMMLGGNIAGFTRTITTVIALETSKGAFALALALGLVLLVVSFTVNAAVQVWGGSQR